jgi:LPXTG-motif cell wall-anchored protein
MDDGVTYRRARADETGISIVVTDGKVRVVGFDNGTYYLEETVTPTGYNKLAARQKFIISDGNLDATFNGEIYSTGSGVHVVNKNDTMLPETGGIGTTLFYVVGGILVAGSIVFLVTRKRMGTR